jgi:hypothetical protein
VVADARRELLLRVVLADAERVRRCPVERFALTVLRAARLRPVRVTVVTDAREDEDLRLLVAIF